MHPYVLQYLRTFVSSSPQNGVSTSMQAGPSQPQQMQNGAQISPTHFQQPQAMHNLHPISTSFGAPDVYQQQQQQQAQQPSGLQMEGIGPMFPQYFPVFDYGHASGSGSSADAFMNSPIPMDGEFSAVGGRSYSPEQMSAQSAWQDFVAQMGM